MLYTYTKYFPFFFFSFATATQAAHHYFSGICILDTYSENEWGFSVCWEVRITMLSAIYIGSQLLLVEKHKKTVSLKSKRGYFIKEMCINLI